MLMILNPLNDFLNVDDPFNITLPDFQPIAGISIDADDYNAMQEDMLQQSINRQATAQLREFSANEGLELISADVQMSADFTYIQELHITVRRSATQRRTFIYVEPPASELPSEIKRLKNVLSEVYNMSIDNIHITETVR